MKICIRGYDIYKNPLIPSTRISGLSIYTDNLLKCWRVNHPALNLSFIRSAKEECLTQPKIIDGICVYGINTQLSKETTKEKDRLLVQDVANPHNQAYDYRAQQFALIVNQEKPDIVNLHNTRPALEFIWAKKKGLLKTNFRTILTLHDLFEEPMRFIAQHLEYFDCLVAISDYVLNKIKSYGIEHDKIHVITSGIDIAGYKKKISAARRPESLDYIKEKIDIKQLNKDNAFLVLMPARRVEHKGHLLAINALAGMRHKFSLERRPYLLISGAGMSAGNPVTVAYEKRLKQHVDKLNLSNQVMFLPPLSSQELCAVYQVVDVVLTPSTQEEGFCLSNIEAMLSRVPVVTSKMGGPLDYVMAGKTGYFVLPGDVESIEKVLFGIYQKPPVKELLDRAEQKASTFTIKNVAENYLQLFKKLALN